MLTANTPANELISSHPAGDLYCSKESGHHFLTSVKDYQPGDVIEEFSSASIENLPNRYTVQKNEHEHIVLHPKYLQYLNHSCDPNCFIDVDNLEIVAIKQIEKGASLNFFYPSTEWKMSEPFKCLCGSYNCLGEIKGAYAIPLAILKNYRLSSFIDNSIKTKNQKQ